MNTTLALGIDMGGTATRWVLMTQDRIVARGAASGATGHLFNPDMRARFSEIITAIASEVEASVDAVYAGITGLGTSARADAVGILAASFRCQVSAVSVSDDMELAYRAAFAPGEGHLVSAGTGAIGLHVAANGTLVRVGGRGILIDDGGSGSWIALTALDRLYRRIDESGSPAEAGILAEELFAVIGGSSWDDTRTFIYGGDRGRIGTLARAVASSEQRGDPLAKAVMADAVQELARLGHVLVVRAGAHPIGYVGGVLQLTPSLKPALVDALAGHQVVFPEIDAALRAAQLAAIHLSPL